MVSVGDMVSEIAVMVQYGMSPHDALIAATTNAAQLLQLADEGVVAPGKRANLVVLDGEPLVDIKAVMNVPSSLRSASLLRDTVMKDGDWVTRGGEL